MANLNCEACESIRQDDPNLIVNGFTDTECASLQNNTGLNPSSGNDDCEDLNNLNDCLVGNMETEVDAYDVCDWKTFMKKFIPNVWTVLKAMICAICGLWTQLTSIINKVNCTYNALGKLVNTLAGSTSGAAFVRYFRNLGEGGNEYWWDNLHDGDQFNFDFYMDANGTNHGSQPADRDYMVLIHNCTNFRTFRELQVELTMYSSEDTRPIATIRDALAQHPTFNQFSDQDDIQTFSWTTSAAVLVKKGHHVKVNAYIGYVGNNTGDGHDDKARVRVHQFVAIWIPVNVDSSLDPSSILTC